MNEFDNKPKEDKTEIHAQAPAKTEKQYQKSIHLQKGQKLYECDLFTRECKVADTEALFYADMVDGKSVVYSKNGGKYINKTMKPGVLYVGAINQKNAERKLRDYLAIKTIQRISEEGLTTVEELQEYIKAKKANAIPPEAAQ